MLTKKAVLVVKIVALIVLLNGKESIGQTDTDVTTCLTPPGGRAEVIIYGEQGPQGEGGMKGEKGSLGPQGIRGEKGGQGTRGHTGASGPPGLPGPIGRQGPPGQEGPHGPSGPPGLPGAVGPTGPSGPVRLASDQIPLLASHIIDQLYNNGQLLCRNTDLGITQAAKSCSDILSADSTCKSGYYVIADKVKQPAVMTFCDMKEVCGGSSWRAVVKLDMRDNTTNCPSPLQIITNSDPPRRVCARTASRGCSEVNFPTFGIQYTEICGMVQGYHHRTPDGFQTRHMFADGITITHGSPGKHIWSYVIGSSKMSSAAPGYKCPCNTESNEQPWKPFIGSHFYCESGAPITANYRTTTHWNDPLWDGKGCNSGDRCCDRGNYGWFHRIIAPVTDNITVLWCGDENSNNEDVYTDIVEIYIR